MGDLSPWCWTAILCAVSSDSLFQIRATRASPPGYASADRQRRQVYSAALAQFDELIEAAAAVGPASRPLPLFYALSQAGRAIAAAHVQEPWRLRGHGLSAKPLDGQLLDVRVEATSVDDGETRAPVDSFSGVAGATGDDILVESATIGTLWASLPEIVGLLPAAADAGLPPLILAPEHDPEGVRKLTDRGHVYAVIIGFAGSGEGLVDHLAAHYPTSGGAELPFTQHLPQALATHTPYGSGFLCRWPADSETIDGHIKTLNRVAPPVGPPIQPGGPGLVFPSSPGFWPRWIRPGVGGVALSSLLTWWALLFGLSMLARYEPASWTGALDYDSSNLAAPLDQLLTIGLDRVPELVLEGLRSPRSSE